jgi:hypothetical protein
MRQWLEFIRTSTEYHFFRPDKFGRVQQFFGVTRFNVQKGGKNYLGWPVDLYYVVSLWKNDTNGG